MSEPAPGPCLTVGSLFSGIGGLELGLEMTGGFRTIWQCEVDPYCREVLAKHWPGLPIYGDITQVDWSEVERPDVLCGGFPCQDISVAGKGAGIAEGTRSGLWFEFSRAIGVLRPRIVIVENVAALAIRGLDIVLGDLAGAGYDAEWAVVRASDVGAFHRRARLFIVAHARCAERGPESEQGRVADGDSAGREQEAGRVAEPGEAVIMAHSAGAGAGDRRLAVDEQGRRATGAESAGLRPGDGAAGAIGADPGSPTLAHAVTVGGQAREVPGVRSATLADSRCERGPGRGTPGDVACAAGTPQADPEERERLRDAADDGSPTLASGGGICEPGTRLLGNPEHPRSSPDGPGDRQAPGRDQTPGEPGGIFAPIARSSFWDDAILFPCADGKYRATQPGLRLLAHGIPRRVAKLKALGNAVVPQVAEYVGRCILEAMQRGPLAQNS